MKLLSLTLALTSVCLLAHGATGDSEPLHYRLRVRVEPATHMLSADVWIQHPPESRFYLYKGFSVRQVEADGKAAPFQLDASAPKLPYSPGAVAFSVDAPKAKELHIQYGGALSEVIAGVNMISPELVELALYSAWFPMFSDLKECTFDAETNLPAEFLTTTNGEQMAEREQAGRRITEWRSFKRGMDIVLLASPRLHRIEGGTSALRVEMDYSQLSPKWLQAKMDGLVAGMGEFAGYYGAPRVGGVLRFVYSPRGGWGYSRIPLLVVSEERARGVLAGPNGEANDFRDNAHEMAHFWWTISDPATPNDWINEALAEFSAFRLTQGRFGRPFAEARLAEYRQNATRSKTTASIAETTSDSPDREINRYDKATLMMLEAQRRFGAVPLDRMLKVLHTRYAGTLQATTATFLEEAGKQMGPDAEAYLRAELYRKAVPAAAADAPGQTK